jgi:hypothetical protein
MLRIEAVLLLIGLSFGFVVVLSDWQRLGAENALDAPCKVQERSVATPRRIQFKPYREPRARQAYGEADARQAHAARGHRVVRQSQQADLASRN